MPFIEALRQLSFSLGIAGFSISVSTFYGCCVVFVTTYTLMSSHGLFFLSISLGTVGPID